MRIIDLLRMSITSLWKRKLRTILTILGVIIGTTSIVVMIALGNGLKESILEQYQSYSSVTEITVYSGAMWGEDVSEDMMLDDDLVEQFAAMEHVTAVHPRLSFSAMAKSGVYATYLNVVGVSEEYLQSMNLPIKEGELPTADDGKLRFFYGSSVITDFYVEKTYEYPYWENGELADVDLMNSPMFIIFDQDAYWQSQYSSGTGETVKPPKKYLIETAGVMEGEPDEWTNNSSYVFCEINELKEQLKLIFKKKAIPGQPTRSNGKPYNDIFYSQLTIQVDEMENVIPLTQTLRDMGFDANSSAEWINSEMEQMNMIQAVLGAIGAVSMLVAAISIANTMMMSIYERTKEIGVMKVLGCNLGNIQGMFLMEAGFIGFIGGIIGLGVSYGLSFAINSLVQSSDMGLTSICRIPLWLTFMAIVFSTLIGMLAGLLPSLRAMRLSPLAAIRNE